MTLMRTFVARGCLTLTALVPLSACAPDLASVAPIPTSQLFGALYVSPKGSMIQKDGTLQLTVTAESMLGDTLSLDSSLTFTSLDRSRVTVDSLGVVTAVAPTSAAVGVVVTMKKQDVLRRDTAFVFVTNTVQTPTSLTLIPQDSLRVGLVGSTRVRTSLAAGATTITPSYAYLYSSDPQVMTVNRTTGIAAPQRAGKTVWVHAVTNAYGTVLRDSVQYTTLEAILEYVVIQSDTSGVLKTNVDNPASILQPCAVVTFSNSSSRPVRFTMDPVDDSPCNPIHKPGNLDSIPPRGLVQKSIRNTGTYTWRARAIDGAATNELTGRLIIR